MGSLQENCKSCGRKVIEPTDPNNVDLSKLFSDAIDELSSTLLKNLPDFNVNYLFSNYDILRLTQEDPIQLKTIVISQTISSIMLDPKEIEPGNEITGHIEITIIIPPVSSVPGLMVIDDTRGYMNSVNKVIDTIASNRMIGNLAISNITSGSWVLHESGKGVTHTILLETKI